MMSLKEALPSSAVTAMRLVRTKAAVAGWPDRGEARDRHETLARMAAQPRPSLSGAPVLVFSFRGWYPHAAWEAVIGHALRLRGIPVHMFNCGGELPLCEVNFRGANPAIACRECAAYPESIVEELQLPRTWLRAYISHAERRSITDLVDRLRPDEYLEWEAGGQHIGRLVRDSVLWFLRKSRIETASDHDAYRRFLIAGAQVGVVAPRLLTAVQPRAVLQLNGQFFAERVFSRFVPASVPVVTYEQGWRSNTLGFDRLSPGGPVDLDAAWPRWRDVPLTDEENATLDQWMQSREAGDMQRDFYIKFSAEQGDDPLVRLGLDPDRPTAVAFTNLVWDTAVLGKDAAFPSIRDWLADTIRAFTQRPDWQLVVRVHPAEDLRPSQASVERLTDVVASLGPLAPNVCVVPPTEQLSSYALMRRCRATLVYTSTTGVEAALRGKPVIVGARVYYRHRGFTMDVDERAAYPSALQIAMRGDDECRPAQLEVARRFAYVLLFRYLKRIPVVRQRPGTLPLLVPGEVDDLLPGRSAEFDALMAAIVRGGPFL